MKNTNKLWEVPDDLKDEFEEFKKKQLKELDKEVPSFLLILHMAFAFPIIITMILFSIIWQGIYAGVMKVLEFISNHAFDIAMIGIIVFLVIKLIEK